MMLFITIASANPAHKTSAVASPNCDEAMIKKLAGDGLVRIVAQHWGGNLKGFNITLDTQKLTFSKLTKKMLDKQCFKGM